MQTKDTKTPKKKEKWFNRDDYIATQCRGVETWSAKCTGELGELLAEASKLAAEVDAQKMGDAVKNERGILQSRLKAVRCVLDTEKLGGAEAKD